MDVEQRARELLSAAYTALGIEPQAARLMGQGHQPGGVHYAAVQAIIAALTPPEGDMGNPMSVPEGFVLVDSKLLGAVRVARLAILQKEAEAEQMDEPHDASMWADCAADLDLIAPRGTLAARPGGEP